MFCPNCGTQQPDDSKFCPKCGYLLNGVNQQSEGINQQSTGVNQNQGGLNQDQTAMNQQTGWTNQQPGGINQQPGWVNQQTGGMNQNQYQQPIGMNQNPVMNQQPMGMNYNQPKSKTPMLIVIAVVICALVGGGLFVFKDKIFGSSEDKVKDQIKAVITADAKALEDEDADAYLATVSLTSNQEEQTRQGLEQLFDAYDLKYTIEKQTVLSTDKNDAQVEVVQVTKKIDGPDFQDNRMTMVHHLKFVDGKWKIYKSDIKDTQYLNK